jgi:hypothetical protein
MSPRVIDLSVPLENGVAADQPGYEMSIENMRHKGIIDQWARRHNGPAPQCFMMEKPSRANRSGRRRITQRRLLRPSRSGRGRRTGKPSGKSAGMPVACFLCRGAHWMSAGFATQILCPWLTRKRRRLASCLRMSRLPSWRIKRGSGRWFGVPGDIQSGCGMRPGARVFLLPRGIGSESISGPGRYRVHGTENLRPQARLRGTRSATPRWSANLRSG